MNNKQCPGCGEWFQRTAENFHRKRAAKDGLKPRCKRCENAWQKRYYQEHREALIKRQKAYYREHRQERIAYQKGYYQENQQERIAYQGAYYQEHREGILKRQRAYDRALAQRRKAWGRPKNN